MGKIDYYVACSIDGYIAGPNEDISGFASSGNGVDTYLEDLKSYDTVIMGRKTYEFGYKFGLQPGQLAYPHMEHYIFSNNLKLKNSDDKLHICPMDAQIIESLKNKSDGHIYLCGGGLFAQWVLENEMIDKIKIKLNPFIQGSGVKLFENTRKSYQLELENQQVYEGGMMILTYNVKYN